MARANNNVHEQSPNAVKRYYVNWSAYLGGDVIVSSNWTVPQELESEDAVASDTITSILLSSGVDGEKYNVTNHVATSAGEQDDVTILLIIKE